MRTMPTGEPGRGRADRIARPGARFAAQYRWGRGDGGEAVYLEDVGRRRDGPETGAAGGGPASARPRRSAPRAAGRGRV